MAASTDLITKAAPLWTGQIASGGVADGTTTTIPLNSATGLTNGEVYYATIDRVDANGNKTPSKREVVKGLLSGSNLINSARGVEGSAQSHNAGAVVEILWTAAQFNDIMTALLNVFVSAGTVDTTKIDTLSDNQTITGIKTFNSGKLKATRPQITTSIDDSNGNEVRKITATASAVNELTEANAATGNNPSTTASGGDTDVGWDIRMKGAGKMRKPTIVEIPVGSSSANLATGDGQAFFRVPEELNGMNLTGVAAAVYTAGTTGTHDVQIRNKTDAVDMLSTKMTIDSTETDTSTAATPAVIDTTKDDVATGDIIAVDIDAVQTTPAKGMIVQLRFELP